MCVSSVVQPLHGPYYTDLVASLGTVFTVFAALFSGAHRTTIGSIRGRLSLYFFSLALVFSSRRPLERVHYYLATALTPYEAGTFVTSKPARWSRSITPRKTLSRAFGSPT